MGIETALYTKITLSTTVKIIVIIIIVNITTVIIVNIITVIIVIITTSHTQTWPYTNATRYKHMYYVYIGIKKTKGAETWKL